MTTYRYLIKFIKKYPLPWLTGIFMVPLTTAASRIIMAYANEGYLSLITETPGLLKQIFLLLAAMAAGSIIAVAAEYASRYVFDIFIEKTIRDVRYDMYRKLNMGENEALSQIGTGEILTRFHSDTLSAICLVSWDVFGVVNPILVGICYLTALFRTNVMLSLPVLAIDIAVIQLYLLFARSSAGLQEKLLKAKEEYTQYIDSALSGKMIIRQMNIGRQFSAIGSSKIAGITKVRKQQVILQIRKACSLDLLTAICNSMMLPVACLFVSMGKMQLPGVMIFGQLCGALVVHTNALGVALTGFKVDQISLKRLAAILDIPEETSENRTASLNKSSDTLIEFDNVDLDYGNENILQNVSFTLSRGEIAVLAGASGSGKSTLVKALLQLKKYSGRICIMGTDAGTVPLRELRECCAYVPAQYSLLNLTVQENIRLGRLNAPEEAILQSMKMAAMESPENLADKMAGADGNRLSGGQAQRVALARAFLRKSPVLILDEPTSALDSTSEAKVLETLLALRAEGCGILMVTHRESTMKIADRIMLLENHKLINNVSLKEAAERIKMG